MGSLTDYAENELMDHLMNKAAYTPAATLYVALCTADPTDAATGASMNEAANANNYARAAITFAAASGRSITQTGAVTFNEASGAWGTLTHYAIVDSNTYGAGNVLAHGSLNASRAPVATDTPSIASGEVVISINSGGWANYACVALLDLAFRNQAYTSPATYMALCTAATADTQTGSTITEVTETGYARVLVNENGGGSPAWNLASSGAVTNANDITFGPATEDWTAVTHVAIVDANTLGNLLWHGSITSVTVLNAGTLTFDTPNTVLTLT